MSLKVRLRAESLRRLWKAPTRLAQRKTTALADNCNTAWAVHGGRGGGGAGGGEWRGGAGRGGGRGGGGGGGGGQPATRRAPSDKEAHGSLGFATRVQLELACNLVTWAFPIVVDLNRGGAHTSSRLPYCTLFNVRPLPPGCFDHVVRIARLSPARWTFASLVYSIFEILY